MSQDTDALWKEVGAIRKLLERNGKQAAAHIADYVPIVATSSDGTSDAVATVQPFPDQRKTPGQQTVHRVEPWGLRSRAVVKNLYGLVVRVLGGGSNPALVGLSAPGYGPDDLEAGETALYCMADGTIVKLTKVGKIEIGSAAGQAIDLTAGAGATVNVNGTDYAMSQWDPFIAALATFAASIKAAVSLANVVTAGNVLDAAITGASSFKSTKAKNG